ncbi:MULTISPECIES: MFS transporter [unclassified Streptomyces]|uniref:MFS transporter n=1 Tax=unclassified Streptomyces TaxID=2593676 RepID=UPI0001C1B1AC|nr:MULTISPECIES: MFS transporter [unclassified Streptomyces]AEN14198.1 drug resistance transporter, EmrB/QacA subfamily [Streptomyces sp. SirexAA-E]MYR66782.1 DHA2 family efflux MFS transporter permease subunit [Streptomyces sp. SID4939]MYS03585.1 DHA2 family efflux MFS transporter permease subunit [Streptomyces sp. SID4940]MYT65995.1 DHA2 family efflux MFS transporter permease subunit [Streptomyces sp. SID8357]MYT88929.1 DHA2 family efflux MFS transporter permease subunit [Streptomyces sp. SI
MTESHAASQKTAGSPERGHGKGMTLLVIASCQLMVVLDVTIVNIALPHMQRALGFSTENLSWVVNAYTLTFGGLLLLGGRLGDILGRRRVFIFGVLLFVFASLLGGLSQESWQLLAARALQGVGGAIASPTALSLITTNFREGPERNKAFGVFAAVSAGGSAIGLLAGGLLVEWLDWRWVLFVNVPIGLLIALATPRYIRESERHPGHFDLLGALTSTLGMVLLVYGFIRASEDGWSDLLTVAAFAGSVVFLALFLMVERRSKQPITPLRMFRDRNRAGAYGMMLSLAAAMFGMFFFLTLFVQNVLDFSPLRAGLAFLPVSVVIAVSAGFASRLLPRWGPKPFMVTGALLVAGGLAWLSRTDVHSSYAGSILGPILVFGTGMGMQFVSLTLMAVSGVAPREAGAASGVLNATQQVGGSLGLSILVTVFGTASRNEATDQIPRFLSEATPAQQLRFRRTGQLPPPWSDQVLASGVSTAFVVSVVFAVVAALVALFVVQVRASDLERLRGGAVKPAAEQATAERPQETPGAAGPGGSRSAGDAPGGDQGGGKEPPGS